MTLLETDLLVMDQVRTFMANDFAVHDAAGARIGEIRTQGSALSRMFLGSRQLSVHDADGSPVVLLDDVMTFGRDRFALLDGEQQPLGEVVKEFTFFSKRLTIRLADGQALDVEGRMFDVDFRVSGPGGAVAQVSRQWAGLAAGLLGRSRYVLSFAPGVPAPMRAAVIGAVVAIDLIRAKEQQSSS